MGNLDYLFEQAGGQFPYDVWLKTDSDGGLRPGWSKGVQGLGLKVLNWEAALLKVARGAAPAGAPGVVRLALGGLSRRPPC